MNKKNIKNNTKCPEGAKCPEGKKLSGGMKFFLGMVFIYFIIYLFSKYLIIDALIKTIATFLKILPILGIVFIIMIISNLYIKKGNIKKYLGNESGLRGWIFAILAGIFIAGAPYVLYPLLSNLKKQGMSDSLLAVFLYNRNVKIPFFPISVFYFGFTYTVIISLLIIIFSVFNGILVGKMTSEHKI
jgi:uncharacterized membrane protein YraQ (UPF0718 family)